MAKHLSTALAVAALALMAGGCTTGHPAATVTPQEPAGAETAAAPERPPLPPEQPDDALWDQLRRADEHLYVVLLRHAIAPGTGDPANFRLGDCSTQRNLSAEGQAQARRLGAAFRQRQVAVVQVLSSQWCRSLDTARLMDLGPVEPFAPLNSFFSDRSTAAQQTAAVKDYLRRQPNRGVIVMVSHQVNITALTGVVPGSGQAVVVTLGEAGDLAPVGLLEAP